ncbi:glucokinase GLK1 [Ascoidea rubescens DSM 1968]|uniref:Phosphotransferase n=1 Tax=Ascoidea rubescens DSM 1968 TaxID=1344418 RepID=A0A1D2VL11_9ASCO|nr:glucokinase GLK1 [Ascoidea rubescens DSM 1968]ODV62282.1 glucokinase GLK1 [Ascoidea rubescens DSM 1968]
MSKQEFPIDQKVQTILNQFIVPKKLLDDGIDLFTKSMDEGLRNPLAGSSFMPMIPSFITKIPTGKEKGLFLACDLGGTNFRVCSVELNGDHTFNLEQLKTKVDHSYMVGDSNNLFNFLSLHVKEFLEVHHDEYLSSNKDNQRLKMSFTFSFPIDQTCINRGKLIRWTKGYDVKDAVGQDVIKLFQYTLDQHKLPVDLVAITNDTVGTLLANSYVSNTSNQTLIGAIYGTGTNGCYIESLDNIKKLKPETVEKLKSKGQNYMVINTEWGSFDNRLQCLPNTKYDEILDSETPNQGYHMFEKRISGMFLGEILRLVLIDLNQKNLLLTEFYCSEKNDKPITLPHRLLRPWAFQTEVLSKLEIDDSTDLKISKLCYDNDLRLETTLEDRRIIQKVVKAVSKRAAYLSAIPIAAIILQQNDGKPPKEEIQVGADGAVIEFYPEFKEHIMEALRLTELTEAGAGKIKFTIAKDGSGVGAALCSKTAETLSQNNTSL